MKIILMTHTIAKHDAIGNDVREMYMILQEKCECYAFCQNKEEIDLKTVEKSTLQEDLSRSENIVIFHHGTYWKLGEELLKDCKARLIMRYHNITPPDFFRPYHRYACEQCEEGRAQTIRFIKQHPNALWMCDSRYNADDLIGVREEQICIVPPFNIVEKWTNNTPDETVLKEIKQDDVINILFVGRIAPNKGHWFLLDIIQSYKLNFDKKIKLRIVGKINIAFELYNDLIFDKIKFYGLEENIEIIGEVTDQTLLAYYLGSDIYINVSEHEGFCVPLIEAQYLGLPVIAMDSTAVPETLGENQLILQNEYMKYAAAIEVLMNNKEYYNTLQETGENNFRNRFSYKQIKEDFEQVMELEINKLNNAH